MYQLSRYDFTTVRGDILTGIYDRFLDKKQRKNFGEYYTPPSIARYIIDRLGLERHDKVLDPACGSGTFLIERYQQAIGEDADRGIATYDEVVKVLETIAGNDLNTFSGVLAQIQLLWHLLRFKDDIIASEFPDIAISEKANSLVRAHLDSATHGRFAELDQRDYAAVVGNPPYVRAERSGQLDRDTVLNFEATRMAPGGGRSWPGISAQSNIYSLFVYRALDSWCRPPDVFGNGAGKLGFIVPLSLCGTKENIDLRRLFIPDGRWTIKEILDLEVIWRNVFDADVLPVIIIAEARPPRLPLDPRWLKPGAEEHLDLITRKRVWAARLGIWMEAREKAASNRGDKARAERWRKAIEANRARWEADKATIRLADRSCLEFHDGEKRPHFHFDRLTERRVDYEDLFSPDGRILTRLTPQRQKIIAKLRNNPTFADIAFRYWVQTKRSRIVDWSATPPPVGSKNWHERKMITGGMAFRGKKVRAKPGKGLAIYKGENIIATDFFGNPQDVDIDVSKADDPSIWRYISIVPKRLFAIPMIQTCPNAVAFDPRKEAFTNTATLFAPKEELKNFSFDLLFLSRIYSFYYVLACRMSFLNLCRSHIYPTNFAFLPWNDDLTDRQADIEALRKPILNACSAAFSTREAMQRELDGIG